MYIITHRSRTVVTLPLHVPSVNNNIIMYFALYLDIEDAHEVQRLHDDMHHGKAFVLLYGLPKRVTLFLDLVGCDLVKNI